MVLEGSHFEFLRSLAHQFSMVSVYMDAARTDESIIADVATHALTTAQNISYRDF